MAVVEMEANKYVEVHLMGMVLENFNCFYKYFELFNRHAICKYN